MHLKNPLSVFLVFLFSNFIIAQQNPNTINKLLITAADSSFTFHVNPVLQNQILYNSSNDSNKPELFFLNRRIRFYFYGHLIDPKLTFKIQLRFEKNDQNLYDAVLKYKANERFSLWFGMETVPAARSQLISLKYLQFVDRSIVHSVFDLQKDIGIWVFYNFYIRDSFIKTAYNISNGEGIFRSVDTRGLSYTTRLDFLPLGKFSGNGDFRGADLERESNPKLAVGLAYNFNNKATASRGQRGITFEDNRSTDISTLYLDTIFKFNGISFMAERIHRYSGDPIFYSNTVIFNGTGFSIQFGYLFLNDIDISMRYAGLYPDKEIKLLVANQDDITFGIFKYIKKNMFKIQTDITYKRLSGIISDNLIQIRSQISLSF